MVDVVSSLLEAWQGRTPLRGHATPGRLWQRTPCAPVAMVYVGIETTEVYQLYEICMYHLLVCGALGLDHVRMRCLQRIKCRTSMHPLNRGSNAETLLPLLPLVLIVEGTVLLILVSILTRVIQCEDVSFLQDVVESRESNGRCGGL